ncbi:NAD-dependent epimerase/dehydratase family protein, partial [Pedobacter sp. ASV12]|uniref:NAD-dependent epimerase/dehydratase family protein n=1 Tax=Pedobacter sp. ASV12 TaxID=2795120 RepID=UPI0018EDEB6B
MKKKISILGYGFIGKNILASYLTDAYEVSIFDRKACPDHLIGRVNWFQGTFNNTQLLAEAILEADVVYHLISSTVPADDI